jgi:GMP synthase-like glutamine amidotransferase
MHGKTSLVAHDGSSVFAGLPSPLRVARYHSLVIAPASLPPSLRVLASADDDGEIMAIEHRTQPVVGVQFHPESAASEYGYACSTGSCTASGCVRSIFPTVRTALTARRPRIGGATKRVAASCRRR